MEPFIRFFQLMVHTTGALKPLPHLKSCYIDSFNFMWYFVSAKEQTSQNISSSLRQMKKHLTVKRKQLYT